VGWRRMRRTLADDPSLGIETFNLFVPFDLFAIFLIFFALAMMILYRDRRKFDKIWVGLMSSPIPLGLAILLRDYDLIPSIAGWILVGTSIVLFWTFLVALFFGKEKCRGEELSQLDLRVSLRRWN